MEKSVPQIPTAAQAFVTSDFAEKNASQSLTLKPHSNNVYWYLIKFEDSKNTAMFRLHMIEKNDQLTRVCLLACLSLFFAFSPARADFGNNTIGHTKVTSDKLPDELKDIGIDEHRGQNIDLNLTFQDETGKTVPLKTYFASHKPVIMALVYYGCPNICTFVLNGIINSLKKIDLKPGEKFEVIAVSIDPHEDYKLAAEKKEAYLKEFNKDKVSAAGTIQNTTAGWHFLVGKQPEITALAKQIGFRYKWVEETKQFAHGSAVYMLTPEGKISRYLYGIEYPPRDVKMALLEASDGKIGTFVDSILLFCFYYDAATKKYVLLASRIMQAGGLLTLAALMIFIGRLWARDRKLRPKQVL
jgi:protein SCO1/2